MSCILNERDENKLEVNSHQDITESLSILSKNCIARGDVPQGELLLNAAGYINSLRSEIDYLNAEVASLKDDREIELEAAEKVAQKGYSEAYKIILDLRDRLTVLHKQWEQQSEPVFNELLQGIKEVQDDKARTGGITLILGQGVGSESGLLVQEPPRQ